MATTGAHSRKKVCYYYHSDVGNYYYGPGHPMKPQRIRMAHSLVCNYGLFRRMEVYEPVKASAEDLMNFHDRNYIKFLQVISPDNQEALKKEMERFNVGEDSPVFEGMFEFSQISAGGSIAAAIKVNSGQTDIAINWAGGLHHAKKFEASGFCYVNDIVLAILELLKYHQRVLYIDIDIHHGDGVEEAFYTTDRVMTVSFHKYGDYFPGTGDIKDIGAGKGKYYSLNFPLMSGMDDDSYESVFVPMITKVMQTYQPNVVVLQCGADSLTGDRLGCFNLTIKGHGKCVEFMKKFNVPLMLLGGGGYRMRNVARCWAYETAVALGMEIPNNLPYHDWFNYYAPDYLLHIPPREDMKNENTPQFLHAFKVRLFEYLRELPCSPGVQMQAIPEDGIISRECEEDINPDERISVSESNKRVAPENEYFDAEHEGDSHRDNASYSVTGRLKDSEAVSSCSQQPSKSSKAGDMNQDISILASDKRSAHDIESDDENEAGGDAEQPKTPGTGKKIKTSERSGTSSRRSPSATESEKSGGAQINLVGGGILGSYDEDSDNWKTADDNDEVDYNPFEF